MSIDATYPQIDLLTNLSTDLGFTYNRMIARASLVSGRRIECINDLTVAEADALIKDLKALKAQPVVTR